MELDFSPLLGRSFFLAFLIVASRPPESVLQEEFDLRVDASQLVR